MVTIEVSEVNGKLWYRVSEGVVEVSTADYAKALTYQQFGVECSSEVLRQMEIEKLRVSHYIQNAGTESGLLEALCEMTAFMKVWNRWNQGRGGGGGKKPAPDPSPRPRQLIPV